MPSPGVMELGRQLCGKMRSRRAEGPVSVPMRGLEIHFYLPNMPQLGFLKDSFTAEELCVEAAKKCCEYCLNSCQVRVCVCLSVCVLYGMTASVCCMPNCFHPCMCGCVCLQAPVCECLHARALNRVYLYDWIWGKFSGTFRSYIS